MKTFYFLTILLTSTLFYCKETSMLQTRCNSDADCAEGQFCAETRCIPKQCSLDSDCPQGYICENFICIPADMYCEAGDKKCSQDGTGFQECLENTDGSTSWGSIQSCQSYEK